SSGSARLIPATMLASALLLAALLAVLRLSALDPLASRLVPSGEVLLDSKGRILQREVADGVRLPIRLDEVAPAVIDATIATEDQRFYQHPGIDPIAIVRSAILWREAPSGASTITQQLARRRYLRDERLPSVMRKMREAILALQIEAHYSKNEILNEYLNE